MRLRLPRPRGAVLDARCHQSSQRTKKSDRLFAFAFDRRSAAAISAPSQYFLRRLAPAFADRIDGGTCLRSTSRYRRTLSARHDRCSSASGRPCRLACGPGVCGGIPTTSEADSCCQAVEGCTTVECEKAAPQPAQAGLGCSAQTVLVSSGGTGCCVNQASHCNGSSNTRKRGPSAGTGGGICRRALDRVEGGRWIECKMTHR
jgi:hypothetical protein